MTKKNVCFRLEEADLEMLDAACGDLGKTRTEYFRYLLRFPLAAKGAQPPCECIVLDLDTFDGIRKELVRWGYHYNQAVRSINAIALRMRNSYPDEEWLAETLGRIEGKLEAVNEGREGLEAGIDALQAKIVIGGD